MITRRRLAALAVACAAVPLSAPAEAAWVPPAFAGGSTVDCTRICILISGGSALGIADRTGRFWCSAQAPGATTVRVECRLGTGALAVGSGIGSVAVAVADDPSFPTAARADICVSATADSPLGPGTAGPVCFPGYQPPLP